MPFIHIEKKYLLLERRIDKILVPTCRGELVASQRRILLVVKGEPNLSSFGNCVDLLLLGMARYWNCLGTGRCCRKSYSILLAFCLKSPKLQLPSLSAKILNKVRWIFETMLGCSLDNAEHSFGRLDTSALQYFFFFSNKPKTKTQVLTTSFLSAVQVPQQSK